MLELKKLFWELHVPTEYMKSLLQHEKNKEIQYGNDFDYITIAIVFVSTGQNNDWGGKNKQYTQQ